MTGCIISFIAGGVFGVFTLAVFIGGSDKNNR